MIEEIIGLWVFVSPGVDVGFEGIVKPLLTQNIFPQHDQTHSWLSISDHTEIGRVGYVRVSVNSPPVFIGQPAYKSSGLVQRRGIFALVEFQSAIMVDKGVEAFIHPSISSFVGAYDDGEPVVAKFMVSHSPKSVPLATVATEIQTWIFHTADIRSYVYRHRIRRFIPPLRIMFYRSLAIFRGSAPGLLSI